MSKPKFISGFKTKDPVNLWLGISLDNSKLKGDNLAVFAHIANKHAAKIKMLYIVVACEIYGHYVGKEMAKKMGDQWILQAKEHLNEKHLKMPFKFVRWGELTSTQEYQQLFQQIQQDYQSDKDFKAVVDLIAKEFNVKKKCSFENARDYLLDECAAYLMFDGKITFPNEGLNPALQYVITKYKEPDELEYIGFDFGFGKISSQSSSKLKAIDNPQIGNTAQWNFILAKQAHMIYELTKEVSELENMIDNLSINYSIIDRAGNYIRYNDSNWRNISQGLLNAKDIDPVTWADCERVMAENKRAIKEEFFKERLFLSIKQPVTKEGEVVGIIVLSLDITEKRQSEIAKKEFIENMSHDLRTPFTGILSLTEYLYSKEEDPQKQELLSEVINSGKSLLALLNQVLELSKQGSNPLKVTHFNLREVIQEAVALVHAEARHKGLEMTISCPEIMIYSDRIRLSRILLNLLGNAVKYTVKGAISIKVCTNSLLQISVEDTGEGIPKEALESIFERFSKLHSSYQQSYFSGAGIGLHLAREYARELGGDITVTSEVGKGSCFTLLLKDLPS